VKHFFSDSCYTSVLFDKEEKHQLRLVWEGEKMGWMREGKKEEKTGNGNRNKKKNFEKLDTKKLGSSLWLKGCGERSLGSL